MEVDYDPPELLGWFVPRVFKDRTEARQEVGTEGTMLLDVVMCGMQVDDILLVARCGLFKKWARFALWYLYS